MRSVTTDSQGISLRSLLPDSQFFGANDVYIQTCCGRWDECQENDLYVARVEADADGHEAVELAIGRGAKAVLSERLLAIDVPQCIVENSNEAFARICQTLAGNPSRYLTTFGVTGTDGKTTVSHLLHSILLAAGEEVAVSSSLRTTGSWLDERQPTWNRAGEISTADMANWLCQSTLGGCSQAIIEATSLQLANHHFAGVELDAAIINNIRAEQLDYHNSLTNYRQVTMRLLQYLSPNGFAVMNADDPVSHHLLKELKQPTISFAIKQSAEITASPIEECWSEQMFLLTAGNESAAVRTEIIGRNHIYNCLAAAATALTAGYDLPTVVRGLENVRRIAGRLERVECGQEFGVFVDMANSPRRLAAALATLKRITSGKVICVAAAGSGSHLHRSQLGRVLEHGCHLPIISAPHVPDCQQLELCHQWLDGFRNPASARIIRHRVTAIEWALQKAKPGDCVIITGLGDNAACSLDDGRWQLTDREICQAWLYEHPVSPLINPKSIAKKQPFRLDDFRC